MGGESPQGDLVLFVAREFIRRVYGVAALLSLPGQLACKAPVSLQPQRDWGYLVRSFHGDMLKGGVVGWVITISEEISP